MRKLATIQKILDLKNIKNADRLQCARLLGWNVVVQKDSFKEGDKCVFFEIDSVLPEGQHWSEFMRARKFRVKTTMFRGALSQGLALDLSILPKDVQETCSVGDDVTTMLGVTKFELENPGPMVAGPFPGDVLTTDELRLQSFPQLLDEIKQAPFYVTVKMDGTSATFVRRDDRLQVCSRNFELKEDTGHHWMVAKRYDLLNKIPIGFAVQGEICGPGISKNKLGLKKHDLYVFNVIDTKTGIYLNWDDLALFCYKAGLKTVPYVFDVDGDDLSKFEFTIDNFIKLAAGNYPNGHRQEGIVVRPLVNKVSPTLGRNLSFKVINNEFLLKDEE